MATSFCFFRVLRAVCFFTGVLPVKKVDATFHIEDEEENSPKPSPNTYRISYVGVSFWVMLLAVNYYIITDHYRKFFKYVDNQLQTCFQTNFCIQLVEKVIIHIHPLVPLISAVYCFRLKLSCIERGEHLYNILHDKSLQQGPLYLLLFFQVIGISSYMVKLKEIPLGKSIIRCYRYIGVISLDCMIMTLCRTIGKTFEDINHEIENMIESGIFDLELLIKLEKKHWLTGNLTDDLNNSFGLNSLFFWPYNIVHTISFLMFLTDVRNHPIKIDAEIFNEFSKFLVFLLVIVYCGWTGTLLTKEAERTKVCLEKMKLVHKGKLDESVLKLIKIFKMKLNARKIRLTAAGFYQIDMRIIQSFLGLILTYWIVLVQFRGN